MLLLIWFDFQLGTTAWLGLPGLVLAALSLVIGPLAASELVQMWQDKTPRMNVSLACVATTAMIGVSCVPLLWHDYPADCPVGTFGWTVAGLIIGIAMVFGYEMWNFGKEDSEGEDGSGVVAGRIARYGFILAYLMMLFGFFVPHRLPETGTGSNNGLGLVALIALIATVKMSDSFAYFTGKSIGKTKLAPKLSPGKTLEGLIGSIFGGWFAAAIVVFLVAPYIFGITVDKPWWWFLLYGTLVTAAGTMGDFAESLIKRDAGVKDSSKWLPGLGGILDITDSLIFAAPVSYFLWV